MVKKWDYTTEPRAVVLVHADTKDYDHPEPAELCYSMAPHNLPEAGRKGGVLPLCGKRCL